MKDEDLFYGEREPEKKENASNQNYGNGNPYSNGDQYGNGNPYSNGGQYGNGNPYNNGYNGNPNGNYGGPNGYGPGPQPVNGFAVAALVTGIISTCCCFCPYASLPCAVAAIVTAIMSKRDGRRPTMAMIGLVLGIIGLLISGTIIAYAFYLMSNPEFMNEMMKQYEEMMKDAMRNGALIRLLRKSSLAIHF